MAPLEAGLGAEWGHGLLGRGLRGLEWFCGREGARESLDTRSESE